MEKYSVLMSVYSGEKPEYLRQSMQSIFDQTVPTDDFVLMCDGPLTPEMDQVIEQMARDHGGVLRIFRLDKNGGLANALNVGLTKCRNDLVARMDSDDVALPDRCRLQLEAFRDQPELAVVGGAIDEFEQSVDHVVSHKDMPQTQEEILRYARMRNPFNHPTVMYRRSVVMAAGSYPRNILHEDYALWGNLLLSGAQGRNLPQTLCYMRVDNGMYNRRGGWQYLKLAVALRWSFYRKGLYTFWSFLLVVAGLTVVCLMPMSLRKKTYRWILR